jgi:DNA uptake protein ComE-like DNA-binding protein
LIALPSWNPYSKPSNQPQAEIGANGKMALDTRGIKLVRLSLALIALAACTSNQTVTNSNRSTITAGRSELSTLKTASNSCLNLNVATEDELIKLPGIGEVIASRIIQYRNRRGRFRRPQEIIIIEGFSERKYRAVADLICVE